MSAALPGVGTIDTVVCDIDGVVVLGGAPIPGASEALHRCRDAGLRVLFVTNNSTKTPATVADRLKNKVGFETAVESIINSGAATARFIADKVECVYVLGTDGLRETLRGEGIEVTTDWRKADAVVAGLDFNVTYEALASASLAVQHGAVFYATNTDASYPTDEGQLPGAGALTAVVERASGCSPIVCGKPHPPMREMIAGFGGSPLIIGDRPDTDLALGKLEGWGTVLVLTGVTADPDLVPEEYRPDAVLKSIAELPGLLGL
jgi:HAD superfamily hydrolase (TIGR01450 family)